jgi:hypothetical protein
MKHPTIEVPGLGPMDHAWDALGDWEALVEFADGAPPVRARLELESWTRADLSVPAVAAVTRNVPAVVGLERSSEIELTDAGGGALQWLLHAPATEWVVQATLWPGALHLIVHADPESGHEVCRVRARRTSEYYRRKYPLDDGDEGEGL